MKPGERERPGTNANPDAGTAADPRFSLANERTFLAWLRTALGILAAGVGVHAFVPPSPLQKAFAALLVILGTALCLGGFVRWVRVERALQARRDIPVFGFAKVVAALFAAGGIAALLLILFA